MGKLSKRQASAMITAILGVAKGKSAEEMTQHGIKPDDVRNALKTTPAFAGYDAESMEGISFDGGVCLNDMDGTSKVIGTQTYAKPSLDNMDFESFDRLNTQNNITIKLAALNTAANNLATQDDGICDLFTTVDVPASETGKKIVASNPIITYGARNQNGVAVGGTRVNLISNLDNKDIFTAGRLALHPILRSSGDYPTNDVLQGLVHTNITVGGEAVQTSPILIGKEVNLRTLCGNTNYLNEFGPAVNPNVTLAEDGYLKNVYIKVTDATSSVVNLLKFAVKGENGTRFNTTNQGNGKDVVIDYKSLISIKTSEIVSGKQLEYSSSGNTLVSVLAETGLVINLKFTLNVNANTDSMIASSSATGITVVSVFKDGIQLPSSSSTVIDVKALFSAGKADSIDLDIFQSNTNNTDAGIVIDVEENSYEIPAPFKAPVTFVKSILGDVPADQLAGYLVAAKITASSMKAAELLNQIEEMITINSPKADAEGFIKGVNLDGIGASYIKPMIVKHTINPKDRSTMNSANTKADISKFILDTIEATATRVYKQSGFD